LKQRQKTINQSFRLAGIGLHTGQEVEAVFHPRNVDEGIIFKRTDLDGTPMISVCPENLCVNNGLRCTAVGRGDGVIYTVEHLLSVLSGLGITNLRVDLNGPELPGLDGSGKEFLEAIERAGVAEQDHPARVFKIQEPLGVEDGQGGAIYAFPADELKISYTLDYDVPLLRSQFFSRVITPEVFRREIAPCRTFCLASEAEELRAQGLGKGATRRNTLVVGPDGVQDNELRFPDEFARHKVLDLLGDVYALGMPIQGHIFAVKSGHHLNVQLLKKIDHQKRRYEQKRALSSVKLDGKREIDISGIMRILPHRYPFLLVDRVVEIEEGKKAVGIKNVTANDGFFQGHFPTRPVMPGVLMVEAMAQTAGVIILTNPAHQGKVAFFMAVNNVKFRKVVSPGDQLVMEVEVRKDRSRVAQVYGVGRVDGDVVVEAEMVFSFTDASYLMDPSP